MLDYKTIARDNARSWSLVPYQPPPPPQAFRLLALPPELRLEIWELIFSPDRLAIPFEFLDSYLPRPKPPPESLLMCCKQVYGEAKRFYDQRWEECLEARVAWMAAWPMEGLFCSAPGMTEDRAGRVVGGGV